MPARARPCHCAWSTSFYGHSALRPLELILLSPEPGPTPSVPTTLVLAAQQLVSPLMPIAALSIASTIVPYLSSQDRIADSLRGG